ncbi:helix-turn-helix transcriptional regulator [Proteus mirabilis]|uniref:Helix-turn-helix transcriptional regulator n=1 Tax=Proteus mirabilis TaxID=584 RepID=A0ABD5LU31_PROMI
MKLSLLTDIDVSRAFATHLRKRREKEKWSREHLAERSTVPASTIKNLSYKAKFHYDNYCYFGSVLMI